MTPFGGDGQVGTSGAPARTRVKVCGMTSAHDAEMVQRAGADAVGLIFAPRSKRLVTRSQAVDIVGAVGPFLTKVGVFVDAEIDLVRDLIAELRLDAVQLHGNESAAYAAALKPHAAVVRALPYDRAPTPAAGEGYPADAWLIDAVTPGSGTVFPWREAAAWRSHPRLILAGGLTPDNVAEAVVSLLPYAVDVASGVEASPGRKSPEAVGRFLAAVRAADAVRS